MKSQNSKNITVFFLFFALSSVLWFLNALEKEYTTIIEIPIKFENFPKNKINSRELPKRITLGIKGLGYDILKFQIKKQIKSLVLDLAKNQLYSIESDTANAYILTEEFKTQIEVQLPEGLSLETISPDTIFFYFTQIQQKSIPIVADIHINLKKQFTLKRPPELIPKKVTIKAPNTVIDTIKILKTEKIIFNELDHSVKKLVKIKNPPNTEVYPKQVTLIIEVEEYTEKVLSVPIKVIHMPDSVEVKLFPSKVSITAKVGLNNYDKISAKDFEAIIDYNQIKNNISDKLSVEVKKKNDSVYDFDFKPKFVEYFIENK